MLNKPCIWVKEGPSNSVMDYIAWVKSTLNEIKRLTRWILILVLLVFFIYLIYNSTVNKTTVLFRNRNRNSKFKLRLTQNKDLV